MADTTYKLNFTGDQINSLLNRTSNLDTELNNYLLKNGGDMTGVINMNGQNISGLGAPTEDTHAARKEYVDAGDAANKAYADAAAQTVVDSLCQPFAETGNPGTVLSGGELSSWNKGTD